MKFKFYGNIIQKDNNTVRMTTPYGFYHRERSLIFYTRPKIIFRFCAQKLI